VKQKGQFGCLFSGQESENRKEMKKRSFIGLAAAVLAVHMVLILVYGMQKAAFHEDEYYTYYTSAGYEAINPYGPIQEKSGSDILSYFYVTEEHRFDFARVAQIQAMDVHPPLYYQSLHFLMSCFPYQFYKWFGILLNSLYSLVSCAGILFFVVRLDKSRHRFFLALLAGGLYAVHPAVISGVMFARMYCMSVMWTVLYMDIFVLLMQNYLGSRKRFALLTAGGAAVCGLAFLTHYFSLYLPFFLTLGFCIFAVVRKLFYGEKCFLRMLVYGGSLVAAIGLAVWSYPASLSQIFAGEQGEGAFGTLLNTDLFYMLKMFLPVLDKNFFAGMMWPALGIFAAALLTGAVSMLAGRKGKKPLAAGGGKERERRQEETLEQQTKPQGWQTDCASLGIGLVSGFTAVWLLSKTSMFLGDASSRYFYTAAAVLLPLMAYCIGKAVLWAGERLAAGRERSFVCRVLLPGCLAVLVLAPAAAGHVQKNVLYLYRDKVETLQYARDNAQYPLVMIYNQDTRFKTWYIANELWPFERIVFVRYDDEATVLESETLKTAEKLIVYMDGPEEVLDRLTAQNENLSGWSLLRHDLHYYVYVLE